MKEKTRSEVYYLDDDHNIVDPDASTKVVINEYDENGNMVREVWGYTGQQLQKAREAESQRKRMSWLERLSKVFYGIGKS